VKIVLIVRHGVVRRPTKVGVRRRTKVGVIGSRDLLPTLQSGNSTVMLRNPLLLDLQDRHNFLMRHSRTKHRKCELVTTRTLSGAADTNPTAANMSEDLTSTTETVNSLKSHVNGCTISNTNGSANDKVEKGAIDYLTPDLNDNRRD
jgi:hypothetical protein